MALVRWSPWQDLFGMQREMDDLMRRMFGASDRWLGSGFTPATRNAWVPAVDVFNRDDDLVIRAELPGVDPENDVEINVQEGVLTIRGERRREERADGNGGYRLESSYGAFERSIALPEGTDPESISASYENGILEVVVPRAGQLASARRIPIEVGGRRKALTARGRKKS